LVAVQATAQVTPLPNAAAYNNRGFAYLKKGDNDRAIADFTQAIQLDPKDALAYGAAGFLTLSQCFERPEP
jgi:Flp pilus assembly protein TadD